MKFTTIVVLSLFSSFCAFAQEREASVPKFTPLSALSDNDPKGESCGEYFRVVKAKKAENLVFRLSGDSKATVLPMSTLTAVYWDSATIVPKVNFLDLPNLPAEKGRMTRILIAKSELEKAACLQKASVVMQVQDE